jgi:hypothetical protein
MARKKNWRTDKTFLPGDRVIDDLGQRRGDVVKRMSEETVLVKFDGNDQEEEISIGSLRRLMQ